MHTESQWRVIEIFAACCGAAGGIAAFALFLLWPALIANELLLMWHWYAPIPGLLVAFFVGKKVRASVRMWFFKRDAE